MTRENESLKICLKEEAKNNDIVTNVENDQCSSSNVVQHPPPSISIALSRAESILISSSGDVVVCRCRDSPYPLRGTAADIRANATNDTLHQQNTKNSFSVGWNGYVWMRDVANVCCDGDLDQTGSAMDRVVGNDDQKLPRYSNLVCNYHRRRRNHSSSSSTIPYRRDGLLGGAQTATHEVTSPFRQQASSAQHAHQHRDGTHFDNTHHPNITNAAAGSTSTSHSKTSTVNLHAFTTKTMRINNDTQQSDAQLNSAQLAMVRQNSSPESDDEQECNADDNFSRIIAVQSFDHSHFYEERSSVTQLWQSAKSSAPPPRTSGLTTGTTRSGAHHGVGNCGNSTGSTTTTATNQNGRTGSLDYFNTYGNHGASAVLSTSHSHHQPVTNSAVNGNKKKLSSHHQQHYAPEFVHGVPTFLNLFRSVKITHVSAHPLGSHVLLISNAGLLLSYGNNDYGQLGVGFRSTPTVSSSSATLSTYVMAPTIITPIVENGGKAVACAAGVSHSLVVVETEEQRLVKASQPADSRSRDHEHEDNHCLGSSAGFIARGRNVSSSSEEKPGKQKSFSSRTVTVLHHQLYGFGRNDSLKIGLVSPRLASSMKTPLGTPHGADATGAGDDSKNGNRKQARLSADNSNGDEEMEVVVLPRRVALQCSVHPHHYYVAPKQQNDQSPLSGSSLSFRSNQIIHGIFDIAASVDHSAALVRRSSGDVELYTWGNAKYFSLGLPVPTSIEGMQPSLSDSKPHKCTTTSSTTVAAGTVFHQQPSVRIVPLPSLVATLSLTSDEDAERTSVLIRDIGEYPAKVALGPKCTLIATSTGRLFSFGISDDGMLGQGKNIAEMRQPSEIKLPVTARHERITSVSAGASHVVAVSQVGSVYGWGSKHYVGLMDELDSVAMQHQWECSSDSTKTYRKSDKLSDARESESRTSQSIAWSPVKLDVFTSDCGLRHSDNCLKENFEILAKYSKVNSRENFGDLQRREGSVRDDKSKAGTKMSQQPLGCVSSSSSRTIVDARAGYDCTYFVCDSGEVYSCGEESGRLGHGDSSLGSSTSASTTCVSKTSSRSTKKKCNTTIPETNKMTTTSTTCSKIETPKPLFGGLHLFWKKDTDTAPTR